MQQANQIEIMAFTQYIHAITSDVGLQCHFDLDSKQTPYNNGKEMHLYKIQSNCTTQQLDQIRAYIVHEVGHKQYTNFDMLQHKPELCTAADDTSSLVKKVWSQLEDHRVDYLTVTHGNYLGDKHNLMNLEDIISDQVVPSILNNTANLDFDSTVMSAMYALDTGHRDSFLPGSGVTGDTVKDKLLAEAKRTKVVSRILKRGRELESIRAIQDKVLGSEATYQLAKKIVEDAKKDDEGDQQQNSEDDEGEVSVDTQPARPEHQEEGEDVQCDDMDEPVHDTEDATVISGLEDYAILNFPRHTVYMGSNCGNYQSMTYHQRLVDATGCNDTRLLERVTESISNSNAAALQNSVRRILQAKSRSIIQHNKKRGKLSGKDAYRVTMKDAKGFNERVFHNKRDALSLDVSVSLLCDFSGSMHGPRIVNAIAATVLLSDTLQALQIKHEIAGFTTGHTVTHLIFKEFGMPSRNLVNSMCNAWALSYANSDADNVLFAAARLNTQRTARKVMIVLSDGSPASDKYGNDSIALKRVLDDVPKNTGIDIIGLGICTDYGEKYYKTWDSIKDTGDLQTCLLNMLQKTIFHV
jgi:hypothetical protein